MRKFLHLASAILLLLTVAVGSARAQKVLSHDFSTAAQFSTYTVIDNNHDNLTWTYDANAEVVQCVRDYLADDWLITPRLQLDAAKTYLLTFRANIDLDGGEELLVAMGNSPEASAMTTRIQPKSTISNTSPQDFSVVFTVPATGAYYLGLHLMTTTDPLSNVIYVHSIDIEETFNQSAPAAATSLSVTPGSQGALTAQVSFTTPTTTVGRRDLSQISEVKVYRDQTLLHTFVDAAPGTPLSYTDNSPATGTHTYSVVAANSYGEGPAAQQTVYIGKDTPGAIENLRFVYDYATQKSSITWDAPTTGAHGGYIDPEGITYNVRRFRQNDALATAISATSYEDEVGIDFLKEAEEAVRKQYEDMGMNVITQFVIDGQGLMQYYVRPISATGQQGAETVSNYQIIGQPNTLPFFETFADGERTHYWRTDISTGRGRWSPISDARYAQDGDGMLAFNTTDGTETAMAHTGNIDMHDALTPVLTFYYFYPYTMTHPLSVKVKKDDGDFETLATFAMSDQSQAGRYIRVSVPLEGCAGHDRVQVGFEVTATTSVDLVYVDNICIIDQRQNDLTVEIASLPRNLKTGETRYLTATVTNLGVNDVATGQYSVDVVAGGAKAGQAMGTAVAAGQSQNLLIALSATIDMQAESPIYAEVIYDADEDLTNNRSKEQTIQVKLPRYPEPTALVATSAGQQGVSLSWSAPAAPRTTDGVVTDGFETYTDFQRTNFGDWTLYDQDRQLTYTMGDLWQYDNQGLPQSYLVWNPSQLLATDTGNKGNTHANWAVFEGQKCLASFGVSLDNCDDWLVSPELSGNAQTVSFYARNVKDYPEQFQLYISTSGIETTNFMALDQQARTTTSQWQQFEYALPQGSKYFALRKVTKADNSWALFVDNVTFAPDTLAAQTGLTLFGYYVYKNGVRVNAALQPTPAYTDEAGQPGDVYRVTAVYNQGESVYSNTAVADVADGIVTVGAAEAVTNGAAYNLSGQRIDASPRRGITIRNNKKVLVK